jgi:hypothetical protein
MKRKLTAAVVTLVVWALVAGVAVLIAAGGNEAYNMKVGYLLEAALVFGAFLGTEVILTKLGLDPPYQSE